MTQPKATPGPVIVVAREAGGDPDEGFRIFTRELARHLSDRGSSLVYTAGGEPAPGMRLVSNPRPLISLELQRAIVRERPRAIIYIHRLTSLALLRARYLKVLGGGCRTVMIDLQPSELALLSRALARVVWPDLLMVASEADRSRVASLGARAQTIPLATDLDRFRPPRPGEKEDIRRRWRLPIDARLVIHVGHLKNSRNLDWLIPLVGKPATAVAVVVSREREPGSGALLSRLASAGVQVLEGYRPNIEEIYRAADCYAFPVGNADGAIAMPLSVLEAIASDLPVVTTSYGALVDHFGGAHGIRFADTPEGFVAAVDEQLLTRPSTRALVRTFSWDSLIDRLLDEGSTVDQSTDFVVAVDDARHAELNDRR